MTFSRSEYEKNIFMAKNKKQIETEILEDIQNDGVEETEQETIQEDVSNQDEKKESFTEKVFGKNKTKKELDEAKIEILELQDNYRRLFADFDNYKKRVTKERFELMNQAGKDMIQVLLPVLDDFDRAKIEANKVDSEEQFSEGVELVYHKINQVLSQKGLTPMETTGEVFDPEFHEAVAEIPAPTEELKGKIIDTLEKGYLLKDKIIRFAKVVVGK